MDDLIEWVEEQVRAETVRRDRGTAAGDEYEIVFREGMIDAYKLVLREAGRG